jgi:predicted dehydrogenase
MIILGAGQAGYRHAVAASRVPSIELMGIYDTSPAAAAALASEFRTKAFLKLDDALHQPSPCFASICTPPFAHGRVALRVIEAGFHPLVEKPFDSDAAMVRLVSQAATRQGLLAGTVAQHRFATDVVELRRQIKQGLWGEVLSLSIRVQRHRPPEYFSTGASNWRQAPSLAGGGALLSIGIHYLDLACWIIGAPPSMAKARLEGQVEGIESVAVGTFSLGKTACDFDVRWGEVKTLKDRLRIDAERGAVGLVGDQLSDSRGDVEYDKFELHARQLSDFAQSILNKRPPGVIPLDVEPSLKLVFDLYASAAGRGGGA